MFNQLVEHESVTTAMTTQTTNRKEDNGELAKLFLISKYRDSKSAITQSCPHEGPIVIGGMPGGTELGNPTVMIAFRMNEGYSLVAETTLALFLEAADVLKAKHGDPRTARA